MKKKRREKTNKKHTVNDKRANERKRKTKGKETAKQIGETDKGKDREMLAVSIVIEHP